MPNLTPQQSALLVAIRDDRTPEGALVVAMAADALQKLLLELEELGLVWIRGPVFPFRDSGRNAVVVDLSPAGTSAISQVPTP